MLSAALTLFSRSAICLFSFWLISIALFATNPLLAQQRIVLEFSDRVEILESRDFGVNVAIGGDEPRQLQIISGKREEEFGKIRYFFDLPIIEPFVYRSVCFAPNKNGYLIYKPCADGDGELRNADTYFVRGVYPTIDILAKFRNEIWTELAKKPRDWQRIFRTHNELLRVQQDLVAEGNAATQVFHVSDIDLLSTLVLKSANVGDLDDASYLAVSLTSSIPSLAEGFSDSQVSLLLNQVFSIAFTNASEGSSDFRTKLLDLYTSLLRVNVGIQGDRGVIETDVFYYQLLRFALTLSDQSTIKEMNALVTHISPIRKYVEECQALLSESSEFGKQCLEQFLVLAPYIATDAMSKRDGRTVLTKFSEASQCTTHPAFDLSRMVVLAQLFESICTDGKCSDVAVSCKERIDSFLNG